MLRIDIAAFYTFDVVSAKLTSERTYYDQASVVEQMQAKVGGGSVAHPDDPRQEEPTTRRADSESRSVVAFLLSILRFPRRPEGICLPSATVHGNPANSALGSGCRLGSRISMR